MGLLILLGFPCAGTCAEPPGREIELTEDVLTVLENDVDILWNAKEFAACRRLAEAHLKMLDTRRAKDNEPARRYADGKLCYYLGMICFREKEYQRCADYLGRCTWSLQKPFSSRAGLFIRRELSKHLPDTEEEEDPEQAGGAD